MREIVFVVPYLDHFASVGFPESYDYRCDFSLMASRWYHAGKCGNVRMTSTFPDKDDPALHFVYDYFFLSHPLWGQCLPDPPLQENLVVFSECSENRSRAWPIRHITSEKKVEYNPFSVNYLSEWSLDKNYPHDLWSAFNDRNRITIPLGTLQELCEKDHHTREKTIILDEPHRVTLNDIQNRDKQHVLSYIKALDVCEILHGRGWNVKTFCTRDKDNRFDQVKHEYPFLKVETFDRPWVPYLQMIDFYKSGSVFFDHYQETHGFAAYENLQMGNSLVVFSENFNPLTVRQFQNGVSLSLYMSNDLCAQMIESQFELNRHDIIAAESRELFSADTFGERLKSYQFY
jgi:hypothetical protein